MKKFNKILTLIIIYLLLLGTILPIVYATDDPLSPTLPTYTSKEDKHNIEILDKVLALQKLAEKYITDTSSSYSVTELTLQYIRKDRYSDSNWTMLLGAIDTNFVDYVGTQVTFDIDEVLLDKTTGKEIDFIHMVAPLNAYIKYGASVQINQFVSISTDYAGWGGDLMSFLEEFTTYRLNNSSLTTDELQLYANSLLGTNKLDSNNLNSFSSSDILADLDAINIYSELNNNTDLYATLFNYYISNASAYNSSNRLASARIVLGSTEDVVKSKAQSILSNSIAKNFFIDSTILPSITTDDINIVAQSFTNYILEIPYLELEETSGSSTVGTDIKVKIFESNSNCKDEDITFSKENIASAKFEGEYLIITPINAGQVEITIYSKDKSVNQTYILTSSNIKPVITKDIENSYTLDENVTKTLSIEANGTNNIYTWYISDTESGEYTKLLESDKNTYDITPTSDMNDKYIKCGVKNDGNNEVFSQIAKLTVTSVPENKSSNDESNKENNKQEEDKNDQEESKENKEENTLQNKTEEIIDSVIVKTGDHSLIIAIGIIVTVIIANIVQITNSTKEE